MNSQPEAEWKFPRPNKIILYGAVGVLGGAVILAIYYYYKKSSSLHELTMKELSEVKNEELEKQPIIEPKNEEKQTEIELNGQKVLEKWKNENGESLLKSGTFQLVISQKFPVDVWKYFAWFYADDTSLLSQYHQQLGHKNFVVEKWNLDSRFGQMRKTSYILPLNAAIGPKETRVLTDQRYIFTKEKLVLEMISRCPDVPFGNSFVVETKEEVVASGVEECLWKTFVAIQFQKRIPFSGSIQNGTISGVKHDHEKWAQLVMKEIARRKQMVQVNRPLIIEEISGPQVVRETIAEVPSKSDQIVSIMSDLIFKYWPVLFGLILLYLLIRIHILSEQILILKKA